MKFGVWVSADAGDLAGQLGEDIRGDFAAGRLDLFRPAGIVVPNANISQWLTLRLTEQLGIAAGIEYPYLENALWDAMGGYDGGDVRPARLDAVTLQQLIFSLLTRQDLRDDPAMAEVWEYIGAIDDKTGDWAVDARRHAWQLADKVSRLFLEYECQRPEMTTGWMEKKLFADGNIDPVMQGWQMTLYHAIFAPGGWRDQVLPSRLSLPQYSKKLDFDTTPTDTRPLYIFGLGHTSPFHLDLLCKISCRREVRVYLCMPANSRTGSHELQQLWGKPARRMLDMLAQRDVSPAGLPMAMPDKPTMLNELQRAINDNAQTAKLPQDKSLQVWACPGLHREVECVYQNILSRVDNDPNLRLTDIAVMVTDMDAYLPMLHEVFNRHGRVIPYNLADAKASQISQYSTAATALFNLVGSSFSRRDVFALISNPCYLASRRANIDMARQWLAWTAKLGIFHSYRRDEKCQACDTGGEDECRDCRGDNGMFDPAKLSESHTWLAGLRRMRLGRVMTAASGYDTGMAWSNNVPYSDMEMSDLETLESFSFGIESLYRAISAISAGPAKRGCSEWQDIVRGLLETTLAVPEDMPQENYIRNALLRTLDALTDIAPCYPDGMTLTMVRDNLQSSIENIPANYGKPLLNGITITSLRRGRLLPFKDIYVIGMNEGVFPGAPDNSTLDLRRDGTDDAALSIPEINRQLFMDIMLSARDRMVLTYNSRDLCEDAETNPCSIITQLESCLERNHLASGDFIEAKAPLNGRSLLYLQKDAGTDAPYDRFVNYDIHDRLLALTDLKSQQTVMSPESADRMAAVLNEYKNEVDENITLPMPANTDTSAVKIPIRCLVDFLINPAEARLKRQLRLNDQQVDDAAEQDSEPFFSEFPADQVLSTHVRQRFVKKILKNEPEKPVPAEFFRDTYKDIHLQSMTPDGVFAKLDEEKWGDDFVEAASSLQNLLNELQSYPAYSVSIGMPSGSSNALVFPPLEITGTPRKATAHGALPFVWKSDDAIETLVFSSSNSPSKMEPKKSRWELTKYILEPLLTYLALRAGTCAANDGIPSSVWTADLPLKIHISYKAPAIMTLTFMMTQSEAVEYLQALCADYLNMSSFDDLPMNIICKNKNLWPLNEDIKKYFYDELDNAIADSVSNDFNRDYSRMALLDLISELKPPPDAYEKVEKRLMTIYNWRTDTQNASGAGENDDE